MIKKSITLCVALMLTLMPVVVYADTEEATECESVTAEEVAVTEAESTENSEEETPLEVEDETFEAPIIEADDAGEEEPAPDEAEEESEEELSEEITSVEPDEEPISEPEDPTPTQAEVEKANEESFEEDFEETDVPDHRFETVLSRLQGSDYANVTDLGIPSELQGDLCAYLSVEYDDIVVYEENGIITEITVGDCEEYFEDEVSEYIPAPVAEIEYVLGESEEPREVEKVFEAAESTAEVQEAAIEPSEESVPAPAPAPKSYPLDAMLGITAAIALAFKMGGGVL